MDQAHFDRKSDESLVRRSQRAGKPVEWFRNPSMKFSIRARFAPSESAHFVFPAKAVA
jgi:hypothetical protein